MLSIDIGSQHLTEVAVNMTYPPEVQVRAHARGATNVLGTFNLYPSSGFSDLEAQETCSNTRLASPINVP